MNPFHTAKSSWRVVTTVAFVGVGTTTLWVICAWYLIEQIPLGPKFIWYFLAAIPLALFLSVLLDRDRRATNGLMAAAVEKQSRQANRRTSALGLTLLFLVIVALPLGPQLFESSTRATDAKAARKYTALVLETGSVAEDIEQTLADIERGRRALKAEWPTDSLQISLQIFSDVAEYQELLGHPIWTAGVTTCNPEGPHVAVPSEKARGLLTETRSTTATRHEVVHAVMCGSIGKDAMNSISTWFHEGMAELYSRRGLAHTIGRASNRLRVWLHRDGPMPSDEFCSYDPPELGGAWDEIILFYQTSWEFMRYLEHSFGRASLVALARGVGPTMPFEDSLMLHLGSTCEQLHRSWLDSWKSR